MGGSHSQKVVKKTPKAETSFYGVWKEEPFVWMPPPTKPAKKVVPPSVVVAILDPVTPVVGVIPASELPELHRKLKFKRWVHK